MTRLASLLILLFITLTAWSQSNPKAYGSTITEEDCRDYMSILASAALEGRETGSRGQKMAAAFLAHMFEEFGLEAPNENGSVDYYQEVPFEFSKPGDIYISKGQQRFQNFKDIAYWGDSGMGSPATVDAVFGGDGSNEALERIDMKNKAVILFVSGSFQDYINKAEAAYHNGASIVLIVNTSNQREFKGLVTQFKKYYSAGKLDLARKEKKDNPDLFFISQEQAGILLGTKPKRLLKTMEKVRKKNFKSLPGISSGKITYGIELISKEIGSENVWGLIRGDEFPDEVIVITAHYDHLGKEGNVIYYGADDNGSGTSALLEIAEAFGKAVSKGNRPKRSILFIALTGEEEGLLGSLYYTQNPLFPLDKTVTNLNMDMVGHLDDAHPDDPNFVSVVGSDWLSPELHQIHEEANERYVGLDLDYTYNSKDHPERFYYRSDQYNFAKHDIPVIFYTSGDHEDYHQPSDIIENIKFERIKKVAQLVFYTAWEIANREKRLEVDKSIGN